MSHYHIDIAVNREDIDVIQNEFHEYLEKAGVVHLIIVSENDEEPSDELKSVISDLFQQFINTIGRGNFDRVN
jgi:hypothetical protein